MRDLLTVAGYEFGTNVRRWEFLAVTFGLPIFMVGLMLLASIPNYMYMRERATNPAGMRVGVVDQTGRLHFPKFVPAHAADASPSPPSGAAPNVAAAEQMLSARGFTFIPFRTVEAARAALLDRQVDRAYVFAADYWDSGHVEVYSRRKNPFDMTPPPPLASLLREQFVAGKVDAQTLERIRTPLVTDDIVLDIHGQRVTDPEADQMASVVMPYSMMVLLMMSLLGSSNYILRSLVEEKESRVREILLSSVRPADLFYGKIAGLGLLGFFQVGVWIMMSGVWLLALAMWSAGPGLHLPVTAGSVSLFLLYFVLAFLLYASIIAGIGAIGSTEKESNQIFAIFVLMFSSPLLFMPILLDAPDGALQRFFTLCPFTSASMVALRTTQGGLATRDLALSLLLLIAAVCICMRLSLKVFELGLLLWGKTPTPREVWRALWH
jgi:ABC-2 type transport system permease protein